jgi:hypothetical protein
VRSWFLWMDSSVYGLVSQWEAKEERKDTMDREHSIATAQARRKIGWRRRVLGNDLNMTLTDEGKLGLKRLISDP